MAFCDRSGCYRLAEWQPVLVLHTGGAVVRIAGAEAITPPAARAKLEQFICHHHRVALTATELVSPAGWSDLVNGFHRAGLPLPDRERLELEWERMRPHLDQSPEGRT